MTALGHAALRQLALKILAHRSGSGVGAEAFLASVRCAYDDLARVAIPLIGQAGVDALAGRALYLAQQEYSWLVDADEPEDANDRIAQAMVRAEPLDPAVATEGAAAVFAILAGLLITFIGEPLTRGLMRKAWPEAFSDMDTEES